MKKFFAQNITGSGRLVRGLVALVLVSGAILAFSSSLWLGLVLLGLGVFVAFEALRGWCFLRACGLRTKL
jgi:hypothetical protein